MTNVDREKKSSPRAKVHILVGPRSTVRVRILSTPLPVNSFNELSNASQLWMDIALVALFCLNTSLSPNIITEAHHHLLSTCIDLLTFDI